MAIEREEDHTGLGIGRLISSFKGKPFYEAWLTSYLTQVQELEDAFIDILNLLVEGLPDNTAALDVIGAIVGQPRGGQDNDTYKLFIQARQLTNKSGGTAEQNITILDLLTANTFEWFEWYPAGWSMVISDALTESPTALAELLSKLAGVAASLEYTLLDDDITFTFADGDTHDTDLARGFASDDFLSNGDFAAWTGDDPDDWAVSGESAPNREVSEVDPAEGHGGVGTGAANLFSDSATGVGMNQDATLVVGSHYTVSFEVTKVTTGQIDVSDDGGASDGAFTFTITSTGLYEASFIAVSDAFNALAEGSGAPFDVTIDNFSIVTGGNFADAVGVS